MPSHTDINQDLCNNVRAKNTNWIQFGITIGGKESDLRHERDFKLLKVIQKEDKVDGITLLRGPSMSLLMFLQ